MPIYPTDGFYAADNPAVVLTGDWVDAERGRPRPRTSSATPARRRASRSCATRATATSTASSTPASPRSANLVADPEGALPLPEQDVVARRQRRLPRGAQARPGAVPRRRLGLDGRADLGDRDQAHAPRRTRSRRRWTTSRRATTSASPPSRRPTTARIVPGTVSPIADIGTIARRASSARSAACSRWATRRSTRRSTRSRRSRRSRGRPTASPRSCCSATARTTRPTRRRSAPTRCSRTCGHLHHDAPRCCLHARLRRRRRRRDAAVDLERDGRALLRRHRPDQGQRRARRPRHELLIR